MEDKQMKMASWLNDLLEISKDNPQMNAEQLLGLCGRGCAQFQGAIEGVKQLKELAKDCENRADYVEFFRSILHINANEESDGILLRLEKPYCTCPMAPEVKGGMLCNCTRGHELYVWSEFFGKPIDVEIVESHLRGGKDCVIKIIV